MGGSLSQGEASVGNGNTTPNSAPMIALRVPPFRVCVQQAGHLWVCMLHTHFKRPHVGWRCPSGLGGRWRHAGCVLQLGLQNWIKRQDAVLACCAYACQGIGGWWCFFDGLNKGHGRQNSQSGNRMTQAQRNGGRYLFLSHELDNLSDHVRGYC